MEVIDGLNHLSEKDSGITFAQAASLVKTIEKLTSLAETE